MNVRYTTTLTYVRFDILRCMDETGGSGGPAEEGATTRSGTGWPSTRAACRPTISTCSPSSTTFDEDDARTFNFGNKVGLRRYTGCWLLDLLEEDDISAGGVTHLAPDRKVLPLDVDVRTDHRLPKWSDGDYEYRLWYDLSHEPDPS